MHLDRGAVQRDGFNLDTDDLSMLQPFKDSIQHPSFRPATHAGINRMPAPEALGQTAPFASLLGNIKNGIENLKVRKADVTALARQAVFDQVILGFGNFHTVSISYFDRSVNTP